MVESDGLGKFGEERGSEKNGREGRKGKGRRPMNAEGGTTACRGERKGGNSLRVSV